MWFHFSLRAIALLFCVAWVISASRLRAQEIAPESADSESVVEGKRIFSTTCAACHGLDGRGGERGPDIAGKLEVQRLSDQDLLRIVQDGRAGTGMPSFGSLGSVQVQAVVRYLRNLQGQIPAEKMPGDPALGKALFFGKAACSQCHMAKGEGGFIAADLTRYAGLQSADNIRGAITDPNKIP